MEINIEADATGRKVEGRSMSTLDNVAPPKVKVGNRRKGHSRIAALKVCDDWGSIDETKMERFGIPDLDVGGQMRSRNVIKGMSG